MSDAIGRFVPNINFGLCVPSESSLLAKEFCEISNIQRTESGSETVPIVALVEPVVAIRDCAQGRTRVRVGLTAEREPVEWVV
jgi:hypothetical protein